MIFTLVQLFVTLATGVMLLLLIWYRPGWAMFATISITSLLDVLEVGTTGFDVGVNVYFDDLACLVLLLTGLLVLIRHRKSIPRDAVPCILLLVILGLSVGRGIGMFGLKQAGNGVRSLFAFAIPALSLMLLRPVLRLDAGRLARWFVWAGSCFSAVAILRWAGAMPMPVSLQDNLRGVVRSLPSDCAIAIGQAFIAAIYLLLVQRRRVWWWWVCAGMFGVVTLALQHRSVWVAVAAGVTWLVFRTGRLTPVRWLAIGLTAAMALGFIMIADPAVLEAARELVRTGVNETQAENNTWAWRVQGYTEATDRVLGSEAVDKLIGPPAGWSANSEGSFASLHIHSRYVETLASYGFVGLAALLVWFVMLIQRSGPRVRISSKIQPLSQSSSALLQAILCSEFVYLVPYFGGMLQGTALGLLWLAATQMPFQPKGWPPAEAHDRVQYTANSAVLAGQQ